MKRRSYWFILMMALAAILLTIPAALAQDGLTVGSSVEGEATDANVIYPLTLEAGAHVVIDLVTDDFNSKLVLSGADGTMLAVDEDSGDDYDDSRLIFIADQGGDYTVSVESSYGTPEGAYTLSVSEADITVLEYDDSTLVDSAGGMIFYFMFDGSEGDVLNIFAEAVSDDDDLKFTLRSSAGEEVARNDDDGAGRNPYIRRIVLPADDTYRLFAETLFDKEMGGNFDIEIETTEELYLGDGPIEVELGDDFDQEVFTVETVSGTSYALSVIPDDRDVSTSIEVIESGKDYAETRMSISDYEGVVMMFRASNSGKARIIVDDTTYNTSLDYEVELTVVDD